VLSLKSFFLVHLCCHTGLVLTLCAWTARSGFTHFYFLIILSWRFLLLIKYVHRKLGSYSLLDTLFLIKWLPKMCMMLIFWHIYICVYAVCLNQKHTYLVYNIHVYASSLICWAILSTDGTFAFMGDNSHIYKFCTKLIVSKAATWKLH
jgi:hypothetical protein